nr:MAG TPA: hypothetical protein [Caudoviricetes sp.]
MRIIPDIKKGCPQRHPSEEDKNEKLQFSGSFESRILVFVTLGYAASGRDLPIQDVLVGLDGGKQTADGKNATAVLGFQRGIFGITFSFAAAAVNAVKLVTAGQNDQTNRLLLAVEFKQCQPEKRSLTQIPVVLCHDVRYSFRKTNVFCHNNDFVMLIIRCHCLLYKIDGKKQQLFLPKRFGK